MFSNVVVTFDDFSNKLHTDKNDLNGFTYGIFSYINRSTGQPILPPCNDLGHGLSFPKLGCIVDFAKSEGIIEILWQTQFFDHQTTFPPPSLKTSSTHTHFGCSFQINKKLANVSLKLQDCSTSKIDERILGKKAQYG